MRLDTRLGPYIGTVAELLSSLYPLLSLAGYYDRYWAIVRPLTINSFPGSPQTCHISTTIIHQATPRLFVSMRNVVGEAVLS